MSVHAPLPSHLRLPWHLRHVEGYLTRVDPQLRLRRSVERPSCYVLERRVRRRPWTNAGMRERSDLHVQLRDGYVHISLVHPVLLNRPWVMVQTLKTVGADLWEYGGAAKLADELEYEERLLKLARRNRRRSLFYGIALEAYDVLNRLNEDGARTRFNNPGLPQTSAVAASPAA